MTVICSFPGVDTIRASAGVDVIRGASGRDVLKGRRRKTAGRDRCNGGPAPDVKRSC